MIDFIKNLALEAGGVVTDFTGGRQSAKKGIVASNKGLHNELIRILTNYCTSM